MSIYIRKDRDGSIYWYDFQMAGRRFSGSTGETIERAARKVEDRIKQEIRAQLAEEQRTGTSDRLTFEQACARYWDEQGQHHANANETLRYLTWLEDHFGKSIMLDAIDDSRVAQMVAKRRGEPMRGRKGAGTVSHATVNRTVTVPLREIILRARDLWNVRTAPVKWKKHLLKARQQRVREASAGEEAALLDQLDRGYDTAVRFAIRMGCRRMELVGLRWTDINFFGDYPTVTFNGKGEKARTVPLPPDMIALLRAEHGKHAQVVFTYRAKLTRIDKNGQKIVAGKFYPMTAQGLASTWKRRRQKSGVRNFRFHDLRHTAATRLLHTRAGTLPDVQEFLGHSNVMTTMKYAHARKASLLAALAEPVNAAGVAESPTKTPTQDPVKLETVKVSKG